MQHLKYLNKQLDLLRRDSTVEPVPTQIRRSPKKGEYGQPWQRDGSRDSDEDVGIRNKAIELIKQNCKPFLEAIDYDVLKYKMFRGYKGAANAAIASKIRPNRIPSDTPERAHEWFNAYFVKKFGEPFRNGMFVTGYESHANEYGTVFLVFPIGDFKFAWSPRTRDLYQSFEHDRSWQGWTKIWELKTFNKWMDAKIYQTTDIKTAIKQRNEIMIMAPGYYGINIGYGGNKPDHAKFMREIAKAIKS